MPSNECEGFQIAIEMRLHGAADPGTATRLDGHLISCAACREFEDMAKKSEQHLQDNAQATLRATDWAQLRKWIDRAPGRQKRALRTLLLVWILFSCAVYADIGLSQRPLGPLWQFPALMIVLAGTSWAFRDVHRRRQREARDAEREHGSLIEYCRKELNRQIREYGGVRWGLLLGAAWFLFWSLLVGNVDTSSPLRFFLSCVAPLSTLIAGIVWSSSVRSRLRRERIEFE